MNNIPTKKIFVFILVFVLALVLVLGQRVNNCTNTGLFNTNTPTNTYTHSNVNSRNDCAPTNTNNDIQNSRNINTHL